MGAYYRGWQMESFADVYLVVENREVKFVMNIETNLILEEVDMDEPSMPNE